MLRHARDLSLRFNLLFPTDGDCFKQSASYEAFPRVCTSKTDCFKQSPPSFCKTCRHPARLFYRKSKREIGESDVRGQKSEINRKSLRSVELAILLLAAPCSDCRFRFGMQFLSDPSHLTSAKAISISREHVLRHVSDGSGESSLQLID